MHSADENTLANLTRLKRKVGGGEFFACFFSPSEPVSGQTCSQATCAVKLLHGGAWLAAHAVKVHVRRCARVTFSVCVCARFRTRARAPAHTRRRLCKRLCRDQRRGDPRTYLISEGPPRRGLLPDRWTFFFFFWNAPNTGAAHSVLLGVLSAVV